MTRIAYVSAEYPLLSHTFIMREVVALREHGVDVHTVTVRRTPPEGLLSERDRREDASTFAILPTSAGAVVRAHLKWAILGPARYLRTLRAALSISAPGARGRLWGFFYFAEAALLAELLEARGIRHVHAHFVNVAASVSLLATGLIHGGTWSFTMHGPLEFDDVTLHAIPEKVRRAAFVACISDFARAQLMRQVEPEYWDKLHVVHCGVRPDDYSPAPAVSTDGDSLRIVTVARLAPMKGIAVLLDAVAALSAHGIDVALTIVGTGEDRDRLTRQCAEQGLDARVRFAGALPAEGVTEELERADVFCLPSFAEGVPVVLMEAMASSLPVVATRVMGIPELVQDGVSGTLVPPGDAGSLADALAALARDPTRRARMGEEGRRAVAAGFDVRETAGRLAGIFAREVPA